jgi:phage N-6-adenine-methyltransferase
MKTLNPTHTSTRTDEWLTPPELIQQLGTFDLDPCSPNPRPWNTAKNHFTFEDNGLWQQWFGRVWLNPPYSDLKTWLNKMSLHNNGTALVFGRTDTHAFHDYVFPSADSIMFLKGRLHFYDKNGNMSKDNCGAASVLIAYSDLDSSKLAESNLKGFHVPLTPEMFYISFDKDQRTWKFILNQVMTELDGEASLSEIYDKVAELAPKRVRSNKNYKAKIRQTLQFYHENVRKGVWN